LTILLTVLGSFSGMFLIFLGIRATFSRRFIDKVQAHPFGRKFLSIVQGDRIWLVLMLLCNPFLPSSIMNYAISLTPIKIPKYVGLTLGSRVVTISFLIFLGSLFNLQEHPLNVIWLMLVYGLLFLLFAWFQNRRSRSHPS
ncbi:MAG TPA: VTT domain-containing protein, partial [Candidatus Izemoplasmatales bacterium]|nr:VTT domain-containing protein [Candidatus Izemoplasmatales bacterium]